jgi:L-methionine (R)-S-oxide reductase
MSYALAFSATDPAELWAEAADAAEALVARVAASLLP